MNKESDETYIPDRSTATQIVMAQYSKGQQKGLQDVVIDYDFNRNTTLALVMCPEWDPGFPHYSIAKLAGVAKTAGYKTKTYDLNVEAYADYVENNWATGWEPWHGPRDWHWIGEQYWKDLHEYVKPVLDKAITDIVKFNPTYIGFSLYYCNKEPTDYMIKKIKELAPWIEVIVGGPQKHYSYFEQEDLYDIVVNGEGEQALLNILNAKEMKSQFDFAETKNNAKVIRQGDNVRFSLNTLPFPDYSDMPMEKYFIGDGALCAISRGCVAKCTFCEETHFYKYRQRTAVSTLEEVRHMYHTYGTRIFYFVDSLVNGNLKELRAFVEGVKAEGMDDIKWSGYSRHDGRMDLEYMQALKDGGCEVLNYGTESGSQAVIDLMDKKVTLPEMEANMRDGKKVGILNMTNWIVGYPNETYKDFEDTLTFIWRMRHQNLHNISQGTGFSVGVDTIVGQNLDRFGIEQWWYYDHWIKKDQTGSIVHKLIKMKTFSIYTDLVSNQSYKKHGGNGIEGGVPQTPRRPNLAERHYTIKFDDPELQKEIEYDYDDFDYNIIKPGISNFADSLVNEIWPFLRIVWRARGGYQLVLKFVKEWEYEEWGARNAAPLNAEYYFTINEAGEWKADFWWHYAQTDTDFLYADEKPHNNDPDWVDTVGPVYTVMNFFSNNSASVKRARKLAWKDDETFKDRKVDDAFDADWFYKITQDFRTARKVDYSFKYEWSGTGKWTN